MSINIIFGSSGLVGSAFAELVKKKKNYIFYSKNNNKFKNIWNLNKNLKNFPYKQIDTLFFFACPRFVKRNFNYKAYASEVLWLKNIVKYLCISKIVYLSSSSIFYKKKNFIGINKLACEHYLKKNKHKFNYIQIWRPFNLVGRNQSRSDHFHNLAIRKMFEERKEIFFFLDLQKTKGVILILRVS